MIVEIEAAIRQLDGAAFQRLADAVLHAWGYKHLHPIGVVFGSSKTRRGTPDTLVAEDDGLYVFVEYSTQQEGLKEKFGNDLTKCFNQKKTGIPLARIREIILCHTATLSGSVIHRLSERGRRRGVVVRFVSASELAHELHADLPRLARDHLHIAVDTGQIISIGDMVARSERHQLSPPLSTAFRPRSDDLSAALSALNKSSIVLITGRPGLGKSRLAIECCRRYQEDHPDASVRCVVDRGADIATDIRIHLKRAGDYLLLVDDANQLTRLEYVLTHLVEPRDDRTLRIVATVRDYATERVLATARPYAAPITVEVSQWSDTEIRELVQQEAGISNYTLLKRITQFAHGNPRLALMAARAAKNRAVASGQSPDALYDEYYRSVETGHGFVLDNSLLLAAGIVAFFRLVDRSNAQQMSLIEGVFGVAPDTLWNAIGKVHAIEAIDIYADQMARVGDQVVATYLLFRAVFRDRVMPLHVLLEHFFPSLQNRITDALNSILAAFDSDDLRATLTEAVAVARRRLKDKGDPGAADDLLDVFWFVAPQEALQYVRDVLAGEPDSDTPFEEYAAVDDSVADPRPMRILSNFARGTTAHRRIALQLIARYLRVYPAITPFAVRALERDFGMAPESPADAFRVQHHVLAILWDESHAGAELGILSVTLRFAESVLATSFRRIEPGHHAVTLVTFEIPASPECFDLRRKAWAVVAQALATAELRSGTLRWLERHATAGRQTSAREIVAHDAAIVLPMMKANLRPAVYAEAAIARAYASRMRQHDLSIPADFRESFATPAAIAADLFIDDLMDRAGLTYEEFVAAKAQRIDDFVKGADTTTIDELLGGCLEVQSTAGDGHRDWQLTQSAQSLLISLRQARPDMFVTVVRGQLRKGNPLGLAPWGIVEALIGVLGCAATYEELAVCEFRYKAGWVSRWFVAVPDAEVTPELAHRFDTHCAQAPSGELPEDLRSFRRYDAVAPGMLRGVLELLVNRVEQHQDATAGRLLTRALWPKAGIGEDLGVLLAPTPQLFKRMYFAATESDPHADPSGEVLDALITLDPLFIDEWIAKRLHRLRAGAAVDEPHDYTHLWRRADHEAVLRHAIDTVYAIRHDLSGGEYYIENIFRQTNGAPHVGEVAARQDALFDLLIGEQRDDPEFLRFLFYGVTVLPDARKRGRIAALLHAAPDIDFFRQLRFQPRIYVHRGRSQVPDIQQQIEFLASLLPLCDSVELLDHCSDIHARIASLTAQLEQERRADFMTDV